jgi:hypothetical protein
MQVYEGSLKIGQSHFHYGRGIIRRSGFVSQLSSDSKDRGFHWTERYARRVVSVACFFD